MATISDIFNRPPAISEDTLQYVVYPPPGMADRASVTSLAAVIQSFVDDSLPEFIWHRDPFELKVVADAESEGWMLEGRMRVGDCVDDEWCVAWLLKEATTKWDVVASIFDSDGEFLLIEGAEVLPSWVTPKNAENRVWIYNSHLHLIPLSYVSAPSSKRIRREYPRVNDEDTDGDGDVEDGFLNPSDAVKLVRDSNVNTTAPTDLETTIWRKIAGYPAAARQHIHKTKVHLPVDIARTLSVNPGLIQKPVETFYTRDSAQLRAARKMARFPPQPSVLQTVTMTRTAYAQLMGQKFHPPKVFGGWSEREGTDQWRWRDIGMKIACGFEMLFQESKSRVGLHTSADTLRASAEAQMDALRRNTDYTKYIQNLVSAGFFKGEVEGSQLWKTLESKAADAFIRARQEDDANRPSFASLVSTALAQSAFVSGAVDQGEDPDDWLNVDQKDLESMLQDTLRTAKDKAPISDAMDVDDSSRLESEENRVAKDQAFRLQELAKKVEDFVEGEGDIEGAKFADEGTSDEEFSDERFSDSDNEDEDSDIDPLERSAADAAARQEAMDKLVPALDPSEYGKMPASFHRNSQRVTKVTVDTEEIEDPHPKGSNSEPLRPFIRPPILERDRFEGVDSDDETDEEEEVDEEEEEDQPQVVGEIEVDMNEEQDEFIEFSRQALGISDAQWADILQDREKRGAFVPRSGIPESKQYSGPEPPKRSSKTNDLKDTSPRSVGAGPSANPNLDSFETVMQAMDAELARLKPGSSPSKEKGKTKAPMLDPMVDDEMDIEAAMDAEVKAALENQDLDPEDDFDGETPADYNLIKNFLESFKSQAGLSGPVSSLAGRLQPGWNLPRDED
ncbi:hypothetical protein JAAARDRAFT_37887 [Jaapia argillacea MUCL 33604]|uniref:SGT1-domain-containing protein n=1 Tax=Jaapia argillacea MUCL 33604 TaxID=933084 RepID=A0A067PIY8_9AGAM|nr:hypothetical protein JAAARDRAFT_37887 [Jaapia argillacea MUCL 33604]